MTLVATLAAVTVAMKLEEAASSTEKTAPYDTFPTATAATPPSAACSPATLPATHAPRNAAAVAGCSSTWMVNVVVDPAVALRSTVGAPGGAAGQTVESAARSEVPLMGAAPAPAAPTLTLNATRYSVGPATVTLESEML